MKVKIHIPASLKDIKLHQYQRFLRIEEPNDMDLLVCMLDSDKNTLSNLKSSEFDRIVVHLNALFDVKHELTSIIDVKGVKMGLIPDFDAITYGENKDITSYINDWDNMHRAIAVLYRPITQKVKGKYLIEDYKGTRFTSEMMLNMPLDVVFGVLVFFWTLTNELLSYIPSFLQQELQRKQTNSLINGQDITKSIHSLKEILDEMKKLQGCHFTLA